MSLDDRRFAGEFYSRFKVFHELMSRKIREILLVSSPYDAYILEEDGSLAARIVNEYAGLNLSMPPRVKRVDSAAQALELLERRHVDLVITMPYLDDMTACTLGARIKAIQPDLAGDPPPPERPERCRFPERPSLRRRGPGVRMDPTRTCSWPW